MTYQERLKYYEKMKEKIKKESLNPQDYEKRIKALSERLHL